MFDLTCGRLRLKRHFILILSAFITLCFGSETVAMNQGTWMAMASGHHSLETLGPEVATPIPVTSVAGARLVLFNYALAQRLGLKVPRDPAALEQLILKAFAVRITSRPTSRTMLASFYQDSASKNPGDAIGDGRALWSGELNVNLPSGEQLTLDIMVKGIGATPMAWTNHQDPTHKDGLLGLDEAVHSFIMSEANLRNQIDSTADLAVIEIPALKENKYTGEFERAAISVRVGNQTRLAHLRFHRDHPEVFRKFADFILRRNLILPASQPVRTQHIKQYLEQVALSLAIEAARYYDLFAIHGSPTFGNRTTHGGTIDLATFRYLDAHHQDFKYLNQSRPLRSQTEDLRNYLTSLVDMFSMSRYYRATKDYDDHLLELFQKAYDRELKHLWLSRLGLSRDQIGALSETTANRFFWTTRALFEEKGLFATTVADQLVVPAAFDVRKVFASIAERVYWTRRHRDQEQERIVDLFLGERPWQTLKENHVYLDPRTLGLRGRIVDYFDRRPFSSFTPVVRDFLREVESVLTEVKALQRSQIQKVAHRAQEIHRQLRDAPDANSHFPPENEILAEIRKGRDPNSEHFNFVALSERALELAKQLTDPLPLRTQTSAYLQVLGERRKVPKRRQKSSTSRLCQDVF